MAGSLVDLEDSRTRLPARIAVDTSLLVPWLLSSLHSPVPEAVLRAGRFFRMLQGTASRGLISPTVYREVLHFVLKSQFRDLIAAHRTELATRLPGKRGFDWLDLYKIRPDLIDQFRPRLERLPGLLRSNGLIVIHPLDMQPFAIGRPWEDELTSLVIRYQLDTSDAAILLEAQRAGVTAIATLDADLRRAALDFDVYTWL